ncbi:hypothetical protein RF11_08487 [Thelohanellus kitauei]|uniref:Uncharacterized protein n=1 Tax=Thelohanellus kitauei TaxID=669202 RepID=A0A0C2J8L5_THEKT|nr:hypothetical protein RF11_08487 [Thelohanellus kitauei]
MISLNVDIFSIYGRLLDEFKRMSEAKPSEQGYQMNKRLFFDVFSFIYDTTFLIDDTKAISFVEIFLKFIKSKDPHPLCDQYKLIDCIHNCIENKNNAVVFINENGMFNFFTYFKEKNAGSSLRFLKLCQTVYRIDHSYCLSLKQEKITESPNELIIK